MEKGGIPKLDKKFRQTVTYDSYCWLPSDVGKQNVGKYKRTHDKYEKYKRDYDKYNKYGKYQYSQCAKYNKKN
jgi:hypothetical protein